jgi:8-oxo-dGTP diphosphatase
MPAQREVTAAGGVVWRVRDGAVEVALVHRPRYDDWTLPKGKTETGESGTATAVREVFEELGATVALSRRIGRVHYDATGTPKSVTYWAMRYLGGSFSAGDEVDDAAWLRAAKARKRLTYATDRQVLADFVALPVPDSVVVLIRHAKAGRRSDWHADDRFRPLDASGATQALRLVRFLSAFGPTRVVSADRNRCVQTVEPFADAAGLVVEVDAAFNDESYLESPTATQTALLSLAKPGRSSVVCAQGVAIPALIERLGPGTQSTDTRKGAAWVLSCVDGDVIAADHYDDAAR